MKLLPTLVVLLVGPLCAANSAPPPVRTPPARTRVDKIQHREGAALTAAVLVAEDETVVLFSRRIADSAQKLRDALLSPHRLDRCRRTLEASLTEWAGHLRGLAATLDAVAFVRKRQLRPRD